MDLGAQGDTFTIDGWLQSADAVMRAQISALGGTVGILDLQEPFYQPFDQVWYYQTTPAWTNDTTYAQVGGTPFTLFAATTDYLYLGSHQRWNLMKFIFGTFGSYGTLTWAYSQGSGVYATLTGYTDGTSGFTANGNFTFTPPALWAIDTVNGATNMFWLRVSAASVTTTGKASQILLNPCYNCLLLNPLYTLDPAVWDYTTYELTFQQVENPPA